MKIACCDDNSNDLELLVGYCKRYNKEFEIYAYDTAKDMLDAYHLELFDIIFLDIEMARPNGYEAAVLLSHEPNPPIVIFTTQTLNYAVRGYGVALRYIPKPITYEMFSSALHLAIEKKTPHCISIGSENRVDVFQVDDITYIEVIRHQITVHTKSKNDVTLRCPFSAVLDKLPLDRFVQVHKSFCVNLQSVIRMEPNTLTLTDNITIPIGRNYKTQLRERLMAFLKGAD